MVDKTDEWPTTWTVLGVSAAASMIAELFKSPFMVSRTILDSAGDSNLPWSEQWPIVKRAFDADTVHTSGLSSLSFFWKGASVLLWVRYPYTLLEWSIRKLAIHLLQTKVNHTGQGKQVLSPVAVQRIALLISDTLASILLNPVIAIRNRIVVQPHGYNYCFGLWDGVFRLIREEGIFIPGATTVALSRLLWHLTHWSSADLLANLDAHWDISGSLPSALFGSTDAPFELAPALLADTITYPLSTIRTRQHLISDSFAPKSLNNAKRTAYSSILQTANAIVRSEGLAGLYRGLLADLAASTIRYYSVKKFFQGALKFVAWQKTTPKLNDQKRWWFQFGISAAVVLGLLTADIAPQLESMRFVMYN